MTSWTTPPPGSEPSPVPSQPTGFDRQPASEPDGGHTQAFDMSEVWAAEDTPAQHPSVDISEQPLPGQPGPVDDGRLPSYWSRPPAQRTTPHPPQTHEPLAPAAPQTAVPAPDARAAAPSGYTAGPVNPRNVEESPVPAAPVPPAPAGQHPHLPAGAHVGDRRGLTAAGAVTVALALGLLGAVIDVNTGSGLRSAFAVCFVLGSALAALLVHREDLKATVVMPPLTFCVLALVASAIGKSASSGSFLKTQAVELVSSLTSGAPVLYAATCGALLVALARALRSAQQPSGRGAAPAAARTAGSPRQR